MEKVKKLAGYCGLILAGAGLAWSLNSTNVEAYIRRDDLLGSTGYDIVDVAAWDQMGYYGKAPTVAGMD